MVGFLLCALRVTDRLLAKLDLSHDSVVTNELYGNVFEPLACLIQLVMYLFRDGAGRLNHLMRSESWATCSEGSTASEATGQAFTPWDDLMNSICIPRVLDFPVRNGRGNVEANKPHAIIRVNVDVALIRTSQFSLVSGSLSHRRGQWSARSPRPSAGLRCQNASTRSVPCVCVQRATRTALQSPSSRLAVSCFSPPLQTLCFDPGVLQASGLAWSSRLRISH